MKRLVVLLMLAVTTFSGFAQSRVTLSVGHAGEVLDIAAHPSRPLAFTAGADGRLIVWDTEIQAVRNRYQISHNAITHVVHHPARNEVALVVDEGVGRTSLRVIEWETGEERFRRDLGSVPADLVYSPAGTYLIALLPSFRSLVFFSAENGAPRSYLDDGFGIVNFIQMGRSERNIMTYVPSRGEFIYWNLQSGEELQSVRTTARLQNLTLIDPENRRALAASTPNELLVVDNLTGQTRASYPIRPVHAIHYDEENDRIHVLTEQLGRRVVLSFIYSGGRLRASSFRPSGISQTTSAFAPLTPGSDYLMAGDTSGLVEIFSDRNGRRVTIGPRPIVPVEDVAFTDGRIHFSLGDRILTLVSDGLQTDARRISFSSVRSSLTTLDELTHARMEPSDDRIFIWGEGPNAGELMVLSPPSTRALPYYTDEDENPILDVSDSDGGPILVHRDGRVVQLSSESPVERFQYTARGAQAADWRADLGVLIAKTRSSAFDSSVIRVDQVTRETVPVRSDAFLSTDVEFGAGSTLYTLGLFGSTASPTTRLLRFSGTRFEDRSVLYEHDGEDASARVVWDEETSTLYTTLGHSDLLRFEGRDALQMDSTGQIARELAIGGLFLAAVNADGSVSLWHRQSGEFLVDIYVMNGNEWMAITKDGAYFASSRAVERYLDFIPARRTRLDLNDFRITLPYRQ